MFMNHVALIGRLTADPELRYTPNGTAVCTVTIAINRPPNKDGQSEADFVRCVVWGKSAENLAKYMAKGRQLAVEGRLEVRSYEKDGSRHWRTEVVAHRVEYLGSKSNDGGEQKPNAGAPTYPYGMEVDFGDEPLPF